MGFNGSIAVKQLISALMQQIKKQGSECFSAEKFPSDVGSALKMLRVDSFSDQH